MRNRLLYALLPVILTSCGFSVPADVADNLVKVLTSPAVEQQAPAGQAADRKSSSELELPAIDSKDIILKHKGFTVSYNADARIPEWVAYELTADETRGEAEREDAMFQKDPSYRMEQAMREDYSGSGWTKGHMACAGDFHWDKDALDETFYLTNICPQDEELNKGDWNYLEKQVRYWARDNGKVWVVSGPVIGEGRYGVIGDRDVVVPDAFFKAVLMEKRGKYHSIAFLMGNDDRRYYLYDCSMTVNDLEELTGLDFFPSLSDSVEESVESRLDYSVWNIKAR